MKSIKIYLTILSTILLTSSVCQAQVGIGTNTPRGMLDVNSSTQGIVFPRVALTATNVEAPVINPNGGGALEIGTTIYNTATTTNGSFDVNPGIYAWEGTRWAPQFIKEEVVVFTQNPLDQRVATGDTTLDSPTSDWVDVSSLGTGSNFTPKYTGTYRIKANFNFAAGKVLPPPSPFKIRMATEEGFFRFTFNGTKYLIYTHSYSIRNEDTGLDYNQFRHDSSLVLYETLTAGITYNFKVEIDMFVAGEFENGGDTGAGRAHVGIGVPCTIEFTFLQE